MSVKEIIYTCFYSLAFALAVLGGILDGFKGYTHNPPASYIVELPVLPAGILIWVIDAIFHKRTLVHKIGFSANALIMLLVILLALTNL